MKVFRNPDEINGQIRNAVVTTGSFDGVHIGHKIIIDRLNEKASQIGGQSCLVTFHPHPRKVLYPEQNDLKLINTQEEKIELLSKTGLQNLIILTFSVDFSKTTSHDFITNILIGKLDAKVIVVGQNHHFGYNRAGDYSYLHELSQELGFEVENIPLQDIENETVSSTKIRKALMEGNIMRANAYLDHQYIISGRCITLSSDTAIARLDVAFFEISIEEVEKLVPPPGIYATVIRYGSASIKSMTLVYADENESLHVYNLPIFEKTAVSSNQTVTVLFYKKIKGKEIFIDGLPDKDEFTEAKEDIEELIY